MGAGSRGCGWLPGHLFSRGRRADGWGAGASSRPRQVGPYLPLRHLLAPLEAAGAGLAAQQVFPVWARTPPYTPLSTHSGPGDERQPPLPLWGCGAGWVCVWKQALEADRFPGLGVQGSRGQKLGAVNPPSRTGIRKLAPPVTSFVAPGASPVLPGSAVNTGVFSGTSPYTL